MSAKETLENYAKFFIEEYPSLAPFRALICAIPVLNSFDAFVTSVNYTYMSKRLDAFCKQLQDEIKDIKGTLDSGYIKSEEFFDLFFKAWEASKRTRHEEKIKSYARILRGAIEETDIPKHHFEDYLQVLIDLSFPEFLLLQKIYGQQKGYPELKRRNEIQHLRWWIGMQGWNALRDNDNRESFNFLLSRLESNGLILRLSETDNRKNDGSFTKDKGYSEHLITDFAIKLMRCLEKQ